MYRVEVESGTQVRRGVLYFNGKLRYSLACRDRRKFKYGIWRSIHRATTSRRGAKATVAKTVIYKVNSRCFEIHRSYSMLVSFSGLYLVLKKGKENLCRVFTFPLKLEIWQFHVVVVQRRQRIIPKSVMHVRSLFS